MKWSMAMDNILLQYPGVNLVLPVLFANIEYDGELSATAYIILSVVVLGIIVGLSWCFYRAITAAGGTGGPQSPNEVGNEKRQQEADVN